MILVPGFDPAALAASISELGVLPMDVGDGDTGG
jgi:hypothetical protein